MKTRKRRVEYFSFYNHTGIEAHLAKMAKNGWLIESITNFNWTYRKIEPRDIHFCVSYYPKGSDFDPQPGEEQQTFHDFCAHTGWELACTWHQMQVFYNEKESPIPLDTDPIMEVDTLHRACKKNFLPSYYILLVLGLLMTAYFIAGVYHDPIGLLSSSGRLVAQFAYVCVFALSVVELTTYYWWHKRAKKAAENGIFVDTPSTTKFQIFMMILLVFVMIWWFINLFAADDPLLPWVSFIMFLYIFAVMFIVHGIKMGLKKLKASRGLNKALTLGACLLIPVIFTGIMVHSILSASDRGIFDQEINLDSLPLSVTDFHNVDEDMYIEQNRNNETFLIGQQVVHMFGDWNIEGAHELPDLQYTITTVNVPSLYKWCKEQMFWDMDERNDTDIPAGHRIVLTELDPASWGANEVYRLYHEEGWYLNRYLLCYENKIVDIAFDWEPTANDMAIVNQKLNP